MVNRNVPAAGQGNLVSLLPTDRWTLEQAKQWLGLNLDEGASCPCCGQYAKLYRRKLYGTMARTLLYASVHFRSEYFHLSLLDGQRVGVRQADFPKLAYWDLIEKHDQQPTWRITTKGFQFASGSIKVPETVLLYDSQLRGFEGRLVRIGDVLPRTFDRSEVL